MIREIGLIAFLFIYYFGNLSSEYIRYAFLFIFSISVYYFLMMDIICFEILLNGVKTEFRLITKPFNIIFLFNTK